MKQLNGRDIMKTKIDNEKYDIYRLIVRDFNRKKISSTDFLNLTDAKIEFEYHTAPNHIVELQYFSTLSLACKTLHYKKNE